MPTAFWVPKKRTLEEDLAEEIARIEALKGKTIWDTTEQISQPTPAERPWQEVPTTPAWQAPSYAPMAQPEALSWQPPETPSLTPIQPEVLPKVKATITPPVTPEPISVPFWKRALQVFAAPFQWVDENVIEPSLALLGTTTGFVPEVTRMPGEDYWEWKKRSWAGWKAPGIELSVPWSEKPVRIDMKGIMELAPWLLIPGAGQVGGGIKTAGGIAGMLGKISKPLGYAIEYSPWGIVEKTVGVAIKTTLKQTRKISPAIEAKIFGKIEEPAVSPVVKEFTTFFDEAVSPAYKAFREAEPALRARQAAAIEQIRKRYRTGEISALEATKLEEKATAVGGIKAGFAVEAGKFTSEKVEDLLGQIQKATEKGFVARDSSIALRDLLMVGTLPEKHNIRDWAKVFGEEFAQSATKIRGVKPSKWEQFIDMANLPRAVLASSDLSATFRQGLILLLVRPKDFPRAFGRQLKAFASEKLGLQMDDVLRSRPLYQSAVNDGVEFQAVRAGARLVSKEEPFMSNLAEGLPLVRRAQRAFTTYLNEMRMSAYEAASNAMTAQGASAGEKRLMANFINFASGRGTLPKNLDKYAPALNTMLFSARYQMSTLQLPRQIGRMLISGNPYMMKEAAKALVTFVGGGIALLGLLKATGRAKVDFDPRASDFGKIVIGDTRLDIWRGYIQYARFAAQLLTGERKSAYGNMNKAERDQIAWRFLQGKASPAFGLLVDLLKGETYMGEDMLTSTKSTIRAARERLVPLAVQDIMDAMEQNGTNGLWTAAPAILGVGVLTYINDFVRAKEKVAKAMGYETWDEIDPKTQRELENSNAELQAAYVQYDRQVMGTAWGDWRLAGKAVEDVFKQNVELATAQYRETGDGVQFREKITDAFTGRRNGYNAREKMPQFEDIVKRLDVQDTAESLLNLGPEQLAIRTYNEALYGDDMYDEYGDFKFDEADVRKEELRQKLGDDMFNYVEEYQAMKFESLSPEFQELAHARKVLKPYWQVWDEAIKIFGEPKTQWALNRLNSFVSKTRKRLRSMNPQIEKYVLMFYTRPKL